MGNQKQALEDRYAELEEQALDALVQAMLSWQALAHEAHLRAVDDDTQDSAVRMTQVLQALLYCQCVEADNGSRRAAMELLADIWRPAHAAFDGRRFHIRTANNALSWQLRDGFARECHQQGRRKFSDALRYSVGYCLRSGIDAEQLDAQTQRIVADAIRPNLETTGGVRLCNSYGVDPRSWTDDTWRKVIARVRSVLDEHAADPSLEADEVTMRVIEAAFEALGLPAEAAGSSSD